MTKGIEKSIWSFFANLVSDIVSKAFDLIIDVIIDVSDVNKYFLFHEYLMYIQIIAGVALTALVAWEALKQISGGAINQENKSITTLILQTIYSVALIFILPWSVTHIFLPLNNAGMKLISSLGVNFIDDNFKKQFVNIILPSNLQNLGGFIIFMTLLLGLALLGLGFAGGIRYIELLITILIAPFAALSAIKDGKGITVWTIETTAIVFTQCFHVLLLKILFNIITNVTGPMLFFYSIAAIIVTLSAPKILRKYLSGSMATGGYVNTSKAQAVINIARSFK